MQPFAPSVSSIPERKNLLGVSRFTGNIQKKINKNGKNKHEITSTLRKFNRIINNSILLGGYLKMLQSYLCSENLLCYKEICIFEDIFDFISFTERLNLATHIVNEYFSIGALNEVNISAKMRENACHIISNISCEKHLEKTVFKNIKEALTRLLMGDTFLEYIESSLYKISISKRDLFEKYSCPTVIPPLQWGDLIYSDWDILMTGASIIDCDKDYCIYNENEQNNYIYRLIKGSIKMERTINGKTIIVKQTNKTGYLFGYESFFTNDPSTIRVTTCEQSTVQRLEGKLILFLCYTTIDGAELGKKCFTNMAIRLAKLLAKSTTFEQENMFSINKSLEHIIKEQFDDKSNTNKNTPIEVLHRRFSRLSFSESIISSTDCNLKLKQKATLYLTSKHLCVFSSLLGQTSQEIIAFSDIINVENCGVNLKIIYKKNESEKKTVTIYLPSKDDVNHYYNVIYKITQTISKDKIIESDENYIGNQCNFEDITNEEWDVLSCNESTDDCDIKYSCVYFKGEKILQESEYSSRRIYRIIKGSCIVEKTIPLSGSDTKSNIILGELNEGDIFGEINFLTGITSTCTIIVTSNFVELQIIDARYIENLYTKHPIIVLKFLYFICGYLSKCIDKRWLDGWIPVDKSKIQHIPLTDTDLTTSLKKVQDLRRLTTFRGYLRFIPGENNDSILYRTSLRQNILYLYKDNNTKYDKRLDLLVYFVIPRDNYFTLIKGRETLNFIPEDDSVKIWVCRLRKAGLNAQQKFFKQAPNELFIEAKNMARVRICTPLEIRIYPNKTFVSYTAALRAEYIIIYCNTIDHSVAILNILFGTIRIVNENELQIISNQVINMRFKSVEERDKWIRSIYTVQALQLHGVGKK